MNPPDPVPALREKLLALTYSCPKGRYEEHCPFALLAGLSHSSRQDVLQRLSQEQLLSLFDLVPACRCPADPRYLPATRAELGD